MVCRMKFPAAREQEYEPPRLSSQVFSLHLFVSLNDTAVAWLTIITTVKTKAFWRNRQERKQRPGKRRGEEEPAGSPADAVLAVAQCD